jgi:hypothetical protein
MTVALNCAPRGCGRVKEGGLYAGATLSGNGQYRTVVWLLGEMWDSDAGCIVVGKELPMRTQVAINPRLTLGRSRLVEYNPRELLPRGSELGNIQQWGLADHVGKQYPTPANFAAEVRVRGANRRITPTNAKQWAQKIRFGAPILFSHSTIPVFENQVQAERFIMWAYYHEQIHVDGGAIVWAANPHLEEAPAGPVGGILDAIEEAHEQGEGRMDWSRTWRREGFGHSVNDEGGESHPGVLVLDIMEQLRKLKGVDIPDDLHPHYQRAFFMMSWLTYVVQAVKREGELDPKLAEHGVEAGVMYNHSPDEGEGDDEDQAPLL